MLLPSKKFDDPFVKMFSGNLPFRNVPNESVQFVSVGSIHNLRLVRDDEFGRGARAVGPPETVRRAGRRRGSVLFTGSRPSVGKAPRRRKRRRRTKICRRRRIIFGTSLVIILLILRFIYKKKKTSRKYYDITRSGIM